LAVVVGGLRPVWDDLGVAESGALEALVEQLLVRVRDLETALEQRDRRIAELEQRLGQDSSNSSRPPSSDAPWAKQPAKKRSSRVGSGRKPGKQPGAASSSRSLVDDPDERLEIQPGRCMSCDTSLDGAEECGRQRRQVVDIRPVPPPKVTEYQRVSKVCPCCGAVTTPGWDDAAVPVEHTDIVAAAGSPVRIGPETLARAALLTCAHFLPVGRARDLLAKLCDRCLHRAGGRDPRPCRTTVGKEVPFPHARPARDRAGVAR
jgi:transposase